MNRLIVHILIIAENLCREFEEGSSTPSSTSTAATLPMPGFPTWCHLLGGDDGDDYDGDDGGDNGGVF